MFSFVKLLAAGDDILDLGLDPCRIFGMHALVPEGPGAITRLGNDTQDAIVRLGVPSLAIRQVPVPHTAACAFERGLEAPLTTDVFELCFLALFDVHADADHAQSGAVDIALNDTATLKQPAPTTLAVADAVLRIVVVSFAGNVVTEASRRGGHVVRVDVGIPAGNMVHAFAGMQVQPITPVAVPTGALGA